MIGTYLHIILLFTYNSLMVCLIVNQLINQLINCQYVIDIINSRILYDNIQFSVHCPSLHLKNRLVCNFNNNFQLILDWFWNYFLKLVNLYYLKWIFTIFVAFTKYCINYRIIEVYKRLHNKTEHQKECNL